MLGSVDNTTFLFLFPEFPFNSPQILLFFFKTDPACRCVVDESGVSVTDVYNMRPTRRYFVQHFNFCFDVFHSKLVILHQFRVLRGDDGDGGVVILRYVDKLKGMSTATYIAQW